MSKFYKVGCWLFAAAATIFGTQVSGAASREVSVVECTQEGDVITAVKLSVSPGVEKVLPGVVHDAVDNGRDLVNWQEGEMNVAEFPACETATTYVYKPEKPDKVFRFFLSDRMPPYKFRLDYLQSTGTQYVLTDWYCRKVGDGIPCLRSAA